MSLDDLKLVFRNDDQHIYIEGNINIVKLLLDMNICKSKREARELIGSSSIYVNGELFSDCDAFISKDTAYKNTFSLVKKGKKNYFLVIWK